jgi:hypothetical protein
VFRYPRPPLPDGAHEREVTLRLRAITGTTEKPEIRERRVAGERKRNAMIDDAALPDLRAAGFTATASPTTDATLQRRPLSARRKKPRAPLR